MKKLKAVVFVYLIRPFMKGQAGDIKDCPCCGELLQFYRDCGWVHMVDGDADCYGAIGYGKGK